MKTAPRGQRTTCATPACSLLSTESPQCPFNWLAVHFRNFRAAYRGNAESCGKLTWCLGMVLIFGALMDEAQR